MYLRHWDCSRTRCCWWPSWLSLRRCLGWSYLPLRHRTSWSLGTTGSLKTGTACESWRRLECSIPCRGSSYRSYMLGTCQHPLLRRSKGGLGREHAEGACWRARPPVYEAVAALCLAHSQTQFLPHASILFHISLRTACPKRFQVMRMSRPMRLPRLYSGSQHGW